MAKEPNEKALEKEILKLKEIIKELKSQVKNVEVDVSNLPDSTLALKQVGKEFMLVEIAFDLQKNSAAINKSEVLGSDRTLAEHLFQKKISYKMRGING